MKKRTLYNLTHQVVTMGKLGRLTPFLRLEIAPGDTISKSRIGMTVRLSPLAKPLMVDLYIDQYVFYVPHRLVDANWETIMEEGPNASGPTAIPSAVAGAHYLFENPTPTGGTSNNPNVYARRAYNLVMNEFFLDHDYETPVAADAVKTDYHGWPVSTKRHYWNELRPQVQINDAARVALKGTNPNEYVTAEDILRAIAEQKMQMKRATYGTRYVDILRSFGVSVNYQMLQRPELVAAGHGYMSVTDIVNTGASQGNLTGYGLTGNQIRIGRKSFPEHGTLIGVMVIRPPYMDRDMRDWMDTQLEYQDFYDPGLELLPPVAVTGGRVWGTTINNQDPTVGYMPWGEWYRKATNRMHPMMSSWVPEQWALSNWNTTAFDTAMLHKAGGKLSGSMWNQSIDWDSLFSNTTYGHYQVSCMNNIRALRMIGPRKLP